MIDTHCHLYSEQFIHNVDDVISRAKEHDITRIVLPNIDLSTIDEMYRLASIYKNYCYATIGLHPCNVNGNYKDVLEEMHKMIDKNIIVAIGEAGLDFYWDKTFVKEQKKALDIQCEWAIEFNLPLILHTRDSIDETIELISRQKSPNLKGVFHCFSGNLEQAQKIIDLGFYIGIGGNITFKNNLFQKEIHELPLQHILLETDAPYLAPMPHRGKRNEPAYIPYIVEHLSTLMSHTRDNIIAATTQNAMNLFDFKV